MTCLLSIRSTVPLISKLTVTHVLILETQGSIHDSRNFQKSSQVSRIDSWVSRIESLVETFNELVTWLIFPGTNLSNRPLSVSTNFRCMCEWLLLFFSRNRLLLATLSSDAYSKIQVSRDSILSYLGELPFNAHRQQNSASRGLVLRTLNYYTFNFCNVLHNLL